MADDESLKPKDFPIHAKLRKSSGTTVTLSLKRAKKTAEEIAERLNAEEDLREVDRWSA